jgi:hypothetical protein
VPAYQLQGPEFKPCQKKERNERKAEVNRLKTNKKFSSRNKVMICN